MLSYIESMRGVAILAVILIHTTAIGIDAKNDYIRYFNILVGQFSGFAVPLFVMISGYVLSISNFGLLDTKKKVISFYIKRAKKILIPYIIFVSIFKILHIGFGHFWFFNLILYLYFLYPLLSSKVLVPIPTSVFLILSAYCLEYFMYFFEISLNPIFHPKYILFMWMGILVYRYDKMIYSWIDKYKIFLLFVYGTILLIQTIWSFLYVNSYLYAEIWSTFSLTSISIILFLIFYYFSQKIIFIKINKKLYFLGELSFGIYIIHIIFLEVAKFLLLYIMTKENILLYVIVFIVSLVASIVFTQLLLRFKLGQYILSIKLNKIGK